MDPKEIVELIERRDDLKILRDKNDNPYLSVYYLTNNGPKVMGYQTINNAPALMLDILHEYESNHKSQREIDISKRDRYKGYN